MEIFFIPQRKRKKRKKIQRFFKIENCQEEEKLRFEFFQFNIRSSKHRKKERKKKKRRKEDEGEREIEIERRGGEPQRQLELFLKPRIAFPFGTEPAWCSSLSLSLRLFDTSPFEPVHSRSMQIEKFRSSSTDQ